MPSEGIIHSCEDLCGSYICSMTRWSPFSESLVSGPLTSLTLTQSDFNKTYYCMAVRPPEKVRLEKASASALVKERYPTAIISNRLLGYQRGKSQRKGRMRMRQRMREHLQPIYVDQGKNKGKKWGKNAPDF